MKLVLPYPPTLNHLKMIIRNRMVKTTVARAYETRVQLEAKRQGARILDGAIAVRVDVFRPKRIGDLDNTFKAAFDALRGIAWNDDSQVVRIHAERFDDKVRPRIEVTVSPAERAE